MIYLLILSSFISSFVLVLLCCPFERQLHQFTKETPYIRLDNDNCRLWLNILRLRNLRFSSFGQQCET